MKDGIGKGRTREDHADVASQLYAAYAQYNAVKSLATIIGEEGLGTRDKEFLRFGEKFEHQRYCPRQKRKPNYRTNAFNRLGYTINTA